MDVVVGCGCWCSVWVMVMLVCGGMVWWYVCVVLWLVYWCYFVGVVWCVIRNSVVCGFCVIIVRLGCCCVLLCWCFGVWWWLCGVVFV